MSTRLQQFAVVRVIALRADRFRAEQIGYVRHPRVGDVGTILETYVLPQPAHEVECCDPASGETVWLEALYPDEIELVGAP